MQKVVLYFVLFVFLIQTFGAAALAESPRVNGAVQTAEQIRAENIRLTIIKLGETQAEIVRLKKELSEAETVGYKTGVVLNKASLYSLGSTVFSFLAFRTTAAISGSRRLIRLAQVSFLGIVVTGFAAGGSESLKVKLTPDEVADLKVKIKDAEAELEALKSDLAVLI